MGEPKVFASLSSGLLARKGAARPAMRPQGFGQGGSGLEDLGWNDMGFEPPKPTAVPRDTAHDAFGEEIDEEHPRPHRTGLTPVQSPVHTQQAEIADRLGFDDEDEEFDETAELYDPDAEDPEADAEEGEAEAAEVEYETAPEETGESEPFELTDRFDEPAPVAAFVPAPPPPPAPVYEPAPVYSAVPAYQVTPRAAPGSKSKAAFTLRLDPERHLKLRLACAVNGRSAQQIVTDAVDQLLAAMPELDAMAEKAKRKG